VGTVFLTGGSGLLGSRLMHALCGRGVRVIVLDRSGKVERHVAGTDVVPEVVHGDLLQPATYASALEGVDTVMHLAAATGTADKETHFRVNTEGTEILAEHSHRAGVRRFVFVSSIAAKFDDKTRYFYAQSKELAEAAVKASGLQFTIVRPTIIAAPGSGVLSALQRLALLPVIPVPGTGKAKVQPIYVDDLVDCILTIGAAKPEGQTIEVGGPLVLTIEELLQEIRRLRRGALGRVVHFPLGPLSAGLAAAEALGIRRLPVSPGQLASFRCDGVADSTGLCEGRRAEMVTLPRMLELSLTA